VFVNQRVLIVGITGKVGRMLAEKLCWNNRVIGISTFSNRETRNEICRLPVHPICFDVVQDSVDSLPENVDYVFFEFAFMQGAQEDPLHAWKVNVEAAGRLAERYRNVKGIVVGSTGGVYPPTRNGAGEETQPEPQGVYALTRYAQEELLRYLARKHQIPMVFLRYFHAYTESEGFVPRLAGQIFRGEKVAFDEPYRNVIWQEDLVRCTIQAVKYCSADPPVINLCGPEKVHHGQLAKTMGRLMGKQVRYEINSRSPLSLLGRCDKMVQFFGPPEVGATEGIRRVVKAVLEHKEQE